MNNQENREVGKANAMVDSRKAQGDLNLGQTDLSHRSHDHTESEEQSRVRTLPAKEVVYEKALTFVGLDEDADAISVTKSNRLIEGQNLLTYRQQKLLLACIGCINPQGTYPNGITVELHDDQIAKMTRTKPQHIKEFIHDAAKAYHSIPVSTPGKKPGTVDIINIAHRSVYDPELGKFTIIFHSEMERELINLRRYTSLSLSTLVSLTSKYAIRMYELISMWYNPKSPKKTQFRRVDMNDLLFPLGVVDIEGKPYSPSYTPDKPGVIKRELIEPSIKQINASTGFHVATTYHKVGRRISAVTFTITKNYDAPIDIDLDTALLDHSAGAIDIFELLSSVGIDRKATERLVKLYPEDRIMKNLDFVNERIATGTNIKNMTAYLTNCLRYNIAELPDVANPYSEHYRTSSDVRIFVKHVLMKIWWKMPMDLRQSIEEFGLLGNLITEQDVRAFIATAKEETPDVAEALYPSDVILESWIAQYEAAD